VFWGGLNWRWLPIGLGLGAFVNAALLTTTLFPAPATREDGETSAWRSARANLWLVLSSRRAIAWLAFLLLHDLYEAPLLLRTIWLSEQVGLGQAEIGLYRALEMAVSLGALLWLDRWLISATPISVALRGDLPDLLAAARWNSDGNPQEPEAGAAAEILALLRERGALFLDELVTQTRRLVTGVERGLHQLIATGLVSSDGFQGLRDVTGTHRSGHRARAGRRRNASPRRRLFDGASPAGRWALVRPPHIDASDIDELAERMAHVLLERYGVVFRDVVSRESLALPWRELRRMEARGTVRGGRFISGFVGEQYALPEAVDSLRRTRREPRNGERVTISAADPVNLAGIVLPGERIPALPGRTVEFIDGVPAHLAIVAAELTATR
jgi:hypothetical protein